MKKLLSLALAAVWFTAVAAVRADDPALVETARKTAASFAPAIVNLSVVAKISAHSSLPIDLGGGKEQSVECVGTMIEPGLVVTALAAIDPVRAIPPMKINIPGSGETTIDIVSELHDLKIRLPDGTELKSRIVLKDEDLDLAFIATEVPLDAAARAGISTLPLTNIAATAEVVDPVIILGRNGKSLNYSPTLHLNRITACITKPRRFYLGGTEMGAPVFNAQGQLLGLVVNKPEHETKAINPMGGMKAGLEPTPIILPMAQIQNNLAQAREEAAKPAKTPAPTSAPAK